MRALSVPQPWAWAIVTGLKPVENRVWRTAYRGPVLIHAGQTVERREIERMLHMCAEQTGTSLALLRNAYDQQAATSAIVGAVTITDCVSHHKSPWFHGPHGFVLELPARAIKPVRLRGHPRLFTVPDDVLARLDIPGYVEGGEMSEQQNEITRMAYSVAEFADMFGVSRKHAYDLKNKGKIRFKKIGAKTVVLASEIARFASSLEDA